VEDSQEKTISEVTEPTPKRDYDFKSISEAVALIHDLKGDLTKLRALKNKLQKENEDLNKKTAELSAKELTYSTELERLKSIETKFQEIETQRREELLNKLPEDKRENYKDLDITLLAKITADFVKDEKVTDSIGGLEKQKIPNLENVLNYEQLSTEQINDLAVKDPVKLSKMYNEFLVRQTKGK
jgi:hypothetical protein